MISLQPLLAYTDLGTWGEQFDILEQFEFKKPDGPLLSEEQITSAYNKGISSTETLPLCAKTQDRTIDPTVILDHEINMPKYNILIKKGTKFNYLDYQKMNRYMIMIDGSDDAQIELALHYAPVADIIIYNASASVIENYKNGHVYIANESFQKTFKIACLPSIYIQQNSIFAVKEINIKELIKSENK